MRKTIYLISILTLFFTTFTQAETLNSLERNVKPLSKKELRLEKKQQRRNIRLQKLQERIHKILKKKIERRKKRSLKNSELNDFWFNFLGISLTILIITGLFLLAFLTEGALQIIAIVLLSLIGAYIFFGLLFIILIVSAIKG